MKSRPVTSLLASVVLLTAVSAPPALADSYSGDRTCTRNYTPQLRIDAGLSGTGSWTNLVNGSSSSFTFPGGASYRYSPYQSVHWVTVAPWFYQKPVSNCWQ